MTARVRLFVHPISHYAVAADRMLAYKGIPAERRLVPYHDRRELLRATGQDYLPALVWNGRVVTWSRIPTFLDRVSPSRPLLPVKRAAVARVLENWGHQVLEERVWRAVVTRAPRTMRDDVERWVFEEMQTRSRGPFAVLRARRAEFRRELGTYFGLVDGMLAGRDWILEEPTVADFGIFGAISPWMTVGERVPARFPKLASWARRIRAIPPAMEG